MIYDMNENEVTIHEPVPALEQYPYEDENGVKHDDLILHYAPDGKRIVKAETGEVYDVAVDVYPCKYSYYEFEETIDTEEGEEV